VKRINTRTVEVTIKHEGTVVQLQRASISPDDKIMTVTYKGLDRGGRNVDNTAIFEKELTTCAKRVTHTSKGQRPLTKKSHSVKSMVSSRFGPLAP
jgi:hypothetical protein